MNENKTTTKCFVLMKGDNREIVAVTASEDDAMDWVVSEILRPNWRQVPFNPNIDLLVEELS
jgi:hypothetical protein